MEFYFDRKKTIQAASLVLTRKPHKRMKYLLLLKLLYIADRESIKERLCPITGDAVYAMKYGPVLTHVKDMIDKSADGWDAVISTEGYDVFLTVDNPDVTRLSAYEIEKLTNLADRYKDEDRWNVVDITHDFPEWFRHYKQGTSTLIPPEDIIREVGRSNDLAIIKHENEEAEMMATLFGE